MTERNQQSSLLGKIAAYTEILAKDPKSTIFVSLSEAYRKMGMLDDARQIVEEGLASHQDFSPAHIVLGRILCQQGDYNGSEASFQQALLNDPENLAALVGYARLNILLGREEKARELLLDARKLSPADSVINKLLLSLPEKVSAPTPRTDDETPAEEAAPSLASTTLAELYLKQGLTPQALEIYRQLSAEDPDNIVLRRKIRDLEEGLDSVTPEVDTSSESEAEGLEDSKHKTEEPLSFAVSERTESVQNEDSPIEPVIATADVASLSSGTDSVLITLNKWLDSIQQRREDV